MAKGILIRRQAIFHTASMSRTKNTPTSASVMMVPDADHVNTSICPGVSMITYLLRSHQQQQKKGKLGTQFCCDQVTTCRERQITLLLCYRSEKHPPNSDEIYEYS